MSTAIKNAFANEPDLGAAFRQLRKEGMFARMNFTCCSSCGCASVPDDKDEFCFFHNQDQEARMDGRPFYLTFGHRDSEKTAEVGRRVCEVLSAHNVKNAWDGDPNRRIKVTDYIFGSLD